MHVHLPKPLHGWREFVGEVGIIVLGVLIALSFEQMVEQWRWHREVDSTRQAIANELEASAGQGAERLSVEDCLHNRIADLAGRLKQSDSRWIGDPFPVQSGAPTAPHWDNRVMGRVYSVPLRGWSEDAWDTAKSSGVLNHMSHDELASYSAIYVEIAGIRDFQRQELALESDVSFLSSDQQLDNASRIDALRRLGQLDALNAVIAGLSSLMIEEIKDLHLHIDHAAAAEGIKALVQAERQSRGPCVKDVRVEF
jgi:hypothetical protein